MICNTRKNRKVGKPSDEEKYISHREKFKVTARPALLPVWRLIFISLQKDTGRNVLRPGLFRAQRFSAGRLQHVPAI